jgi:hypothetical protein
MFVRLANRPNWNSFRKLGREKDPFPSPALLLLLLLLNFFSCSIPEIAQEAAAFPNFRHDSMSYPFIKLQRKKPASKNVSGGDRVSFTGIDLAWAVELS